MYAFIVDTDEYAGNFEREMTAYMTGRTGECGVGKDIAKVFEEEVDLPEYYFDNLIESRPDEHGCNRPCSIWDTPDWFNDGKGDNFREGEKESEKKYPCYNSVAIFMYKRPSDEDVEFLIDRAKKWCEYVKLQHTLVEGKEDKWCFLKCGNIQGFRLIEETTIQEELKSWGI